MSRGAIRSAEETQEQENAVMALFEYRENLGVGYPTHNQIQAVTDLPRGTIGNLLISMVAKGKLEKVGKGQWRIKREFE